MKINKKIKILFIHHAAGWGGSPVSMLNTIMALDKSKYTFEVLIIHDSIISKILMEHGINVKVAQSIFYKRFYDNYVHSVANEKKWYRIDLEAKSILSWLLNKYYFAPRELQGYKYDIAHLNSSTLTDWLAPCKAKGKVVIHIREPFSKGKFGVRYKFLKSQMRKYADKIIAISIDNAKRINIPEKTQVIYNFLNTKENSTVFEKNNHFGEVLYLGGYHKIKGFYTIVESLDHINDGIKILFCGDFLTDINESGFWGTIKKAIKKFLPFHRKLKAALIKIRNHPNSIFVGLVNNTTQLIQDSEFLISPFSKPHFSRPVIEAFAHKKCVIGSDVEGMDEIIDHNKNGLIVKKDNPLELAHAINYLHSNPEIRLKMGENGYLKAQKLFSSRNILLLDQMYDTLVK